MQLGVRDAASILVVSEKTIYRWIRSGKLPAYRVNEQYRFNRAELLEWATSQRINVSASIFQEPAAGGPEELTTLCEAMEAGGIHYRIGGQDKASVLRNVVDVMRLGDEVDRQFLLQVLLARESLGSTGIGEGIAIPHVRNPIVMYIQRPMITLCFLERPIDFAALDGRPVHTLFTIVSPTVRGHLNLLSTLAFSLREEGFKQAVLQQATREVILEEARRAQAKLLQETAAQGSGQ